MKQQNLITWRRLAAIAVVLILLLLSVVAYLLWRGYLPSAETVTAGKFPEELIYVRSEDGITNCGAIFTAPKDSTKPIVIIWIHGWGVNFYYPTYVMIGRALAELGYTCITANTRMHDIGFNIGERGGRRIRGGGYWGVSTEAVRDLAAWIDFAKAEGFKKVVLVGHSAGWGTVRLYQSTKQDERVAGVVLASGAVRPDTQVPDSAMLAQASRLVAEGHGDDLLRFPNRRFPSFVSADTYLDIATNYPPEQRDFFGVQTSNPGVTRIHCPLLAFFGTRGDVGAEPDLELLKSSIQRQSNGPSRVNTVMIQGADHMYAGQEAQVAQVIAKWADSQLLPATENNHAPQQQ